MASEEIEQLKSAFKEEISHWQEKFNEIKIQLEKVREEKSEKQISDSSSDNVQVIEKIENNCDKATEGLENMEEKWCSRLNDLSERMLIADQYSRCNSMLIRGYKSLPKLNDMDFIFATACEINSFIPFPERKVHPFHIDAAHPLPTKSSNSKKVVIVKFANRWIKNHIMSCKDDLEGSGLSVTEHLTPYTLELSAAAEKLVGPANTWIYNTTVFARLNGVRYTIKRVKDLDYLSTVIKKFTSTNPNIPNSSTEKTTTDSNDSNSPLTQHAHYLPASPLLPEPKSANNQYSNRNQSIDTYLKNFPSLCENLIASDRSTPPRRINTLHRIPSRNGRGRGGDHYRRGRLHSQYNNHTY